MRWPLTRVVCRGRYRTPDGESSGTLGVHRGACGRSLRDSAHPGTSSFASNHEAGALVLRPGRRVSLPSPLLHFECFLWSSRLSLSLSFRSFFEVRGRISPPYDGHTDVLHFRETCTCLSIVYGRWLSAGGGRGRERMGEGNGRGSGWLRIREKLGFLREGR